MKLLKKVPKVVVAIAAALVLVYIIVTLIGHFSTASRINDRKEEIQQRQERIFTDDE